MSENRSNDLMKVIKLITAITLFFMGSMNIAKGNYLIATLLFVCSYWVIRAFNSHNIITVRREVSMQNQSNILNHDEDEKYPINDRQKPIEESSEVKKSSALDIMVPSRDQNELPALRKSKIKKMSATKSEKNHRSPLELNKNKKASFGSNSMPQYSSLKPLKENKSVSDEILYFDVQNDAMYTIVEPKTPQNFYDRSDIKLNTDEYLLMDENLKNKSDISDFEGLKHHSNKTSIDAKHFEKKNISNEKQNRSKKATEETKELIFLVNETNQNNFGIKKSYKSIKDTNDSVKFDEHDEIEKDKYKKSKSKKNKDKSQRSKILKKSADIDAELELTPITVCKTPIEFDLNGPLKDFEKDYDILSSDESDKQDNHDAKLSDSPCPDNESFMDNLLLHAENKTEFSDKNLQKLDDIHTKSLICLINKQIESHNLRQYLDEIINEFDSIDDNDAQKILKEQSERFKESFSLNSTSYNLGDSAILKDYNSEEIFLRKFYEKDLRMLIYLNTDIFRVLSQSNLQLITKKNIADYFIMNEESIHDKLVKNRLVSEEFNLFSQLKSENINILGIKNLSWSLLLKMYQIIKDDEIKAIYIDNIRSIQSFYIYAALKIMHWYDVSHNNSKDSKDQTLNIFNCFIELAYATKANIDPKVLRLMFTLIQSTLKYLGENKFVVLKETLASSKDTVDPNWQTIQKKRNHSQVIGKDLESEPYNRFRNIIPFDHNLVELKPSVDFVSYVNASVMEFSINMRIYRFIATQAPIKRTINHFWHMISQNNLAVSIRLNGDDSEDPANDYIKHRKNSSSKSIKCGHDDDDNSLTIKVKYQLRFGPFHIRLVKIDLRKDSVRIKSFYHVNISNFPWPDHGTASLKDIKLMMQLLFDPKVALNDASDIDDNVDHELIAKVIEQAMIRQKLLIHCRAGVGRTGTLISMIIIYDQYRRNCIDIDIPSIVNQGRECRCYFVQTQSQYQSILELAEDLMLSNCQNNETSKADNVEIY